MISEDSSFSFESWAYGKTEIQQELWLFQSQAWREELAGPGQ